MNQGADSLQAPLPRHVAIIMDGNGRWASQRGLPRSTGHVVGVEAVRRLIAACVERGIVCLTLFAFSSENWVRPAEEVTALMRLFLLALSREIRRLHRHGIRLRLIGERSRFAPELQHQIAAAESLTAGNRRMTLCIAANYGGRWDIVQAVQRWQAGQPEGQVPGPQDIAAGLSTAELPPLDLLIRTGGEKRLSNFLLWQAAEAQLYFSDVWWPDFDAKELDQALAFYCERQSRVCTAPQQRPVLL